MDKRSVVSLRTGQTFVARQPILDSSRRVFGYELLLRQAPGAAASDALPDRASARVISDVLMAIDLDTLVDGRKAFVTVGRRVLLDGIPSILPREKVVLELSADIEADAEVIGACRELRQAGYSIAVDDFVLNEGTAELVPFANYLKVDFLAMTDPEARARVLGARRPGGVALIAKKVETFDAFEQAVREGYAYFQGFFFGRPIILQGRSVPGHQIAHLQLVRALHEPDLSVHQLENLIKHDAALCYRILRTVNSSGFGLRTPVHSIREALVLLGRDTVRRWASLWALAGMSVDAHAELVVMSTIRARCCEMLGGKLGGDAGAAEGFLVGMCSLLDAILERPMRLVLADLPLAEETEAALLGEDNSMRRLLDCAVAYERGEWDRCVQLARAAGVDPALLAVAYSEALRWSRELNIGSTAVKS